MNQNFLIGTIEQGITKNTKPWATAKDSWEALVNCYQWRGRVVRKPPYSNLGQLSFIISSQFVGVSAQNFTANLFAVFSLSGVMIVPSFTTITINGGAVYTLEEDPNNPGSIIQVSGTGVDYLNGSINYLTGDLTLNFSVNPGGNVVITFSYAYLLPVMGLRTRELFSLNQQDTIGFDTKYSYRYSNTLEQFTPLASIMPVVWSGTDYQFFFTTNYAGSFWATNSKPGLHGAAISNVTYIGTAVTITTTAPHGFTTGQSVSLINIGGVTGLNGNNYVITVTGANTFTITAATAPTGIYTTGGIALNAYVSVTNEDGIRYYGSLTNGTGWANYNPPVDPNNALAGSLLIFAYRGYLVFLNTTVGNESGVFNYGNQARWTSANESPYYSEPVPTTPNPQTVNPDTARSDLFGRGGFTNAPTQEVIIGAAFIRDILVVFFERSCWRLRFVNNAQNPFVWERINVELGASATFSIIPFDKGAMAIGERGIVIADANDVARIDDVIPDQVFSIRIENNGMERVYGIRTFRTKLNYWTMPSSSEPTSIYPDQVLVYNYETKTWATFDDCFTCFGYLYKFDDMTWGDLTAAWSTYDNITWGGGEIEQGYEQIIAGNQQGFVLSLESSQTDVNENPNFDNGASLVITGIVNGSLPDTPSVFSSINHNLPNESWIVLSGIAGTTDVTGVTLNGRSFKVIVIDADTFTLKEFTSVSAGNATGGTFNFTLAVPYIPIFPGSVYITVGSITFVDNGSNGVLTDLNGTLSTGIINYTSGAITLFFVPVIGSTPVYIRVVSQNPAQSMANVITTGTYAGGGFISRTSNFEIKTKVFNFLEKDQRARLSKIDFYMNATRNGEFTVDILSDSSTQPVNSPLSDNPRQNVVRTVQGQYQFGIGTEVIYRLYSDAVGQTLQADMYMSDQQMGVPLIANSNIELVAMNWSLRPGGRII